jgi:threonine dehydratase
MPPFTIDEIQAVRDKLAEHIVETPAWRWQNRDIRSLVGGETEVFLKLELWQHGGSFKLRGALNVMLNADQDQLQRCGVTGASAGNHAIALSLAANLLGVSAKVVMPKTASPSRVERCQQLGAEVVLVDDVKEVFSRVDQIEQAENRVFVHPFEGPFTAQGTATVGLEFCQQVPDMDALIVPIGGGGLMAGISTITKQMQPNCTVIGVEPEGADTMYRSFQTGQPEKLDQLRTIADSLGAPYALPYSFDLCRRHVDEIILINDDALRRAQALLFRSMKLATEPAGAAATAALCEPLRDRLRGKRVGLLVCGTNTDINTFSEQVKAAQNTVQ